MRYSRSTLRVLDAPCVREELFFDRSGDAFRDRHAPKNTPDMAGGNPLLAGDLAEVWTPLILLSKRDKIQARLGVQIETSMMAPIYSEWNNQVKEIIPSRIELPPFGNLAQSVFNLRKSLGYSQKQFAEAVGVSQSNVAKWEKGDLKPPGPICATISKLAPDQEREFWLAQAGLTRIAQIEEGTGIRWIPLLRDAAAAGTPRAIDESEVEEMISFPRRWLPSGGSIFAIKVVGDSMSPILEDGYIALVDVSSRSPQRLEGRMIAARDEYGVTIKWLRKQEAMYLLVPQNTSPRHPIRVWTTADGHTIVGEVIRWIGQPPPLRKRK